MCARPRQPIELVKAKGKKHLTKQEIESREKSELKVDLKDVSVPNYLPSKLEIHPTKDGYKAMAKSVINLIDKKTLAK